HTVTIVDNGKLAVSNSGTGEFDLIVMDVQMPEMDGLEATRAIREREKCSGKRLPILALTAHAAAEDCDRCLATGMDGYVSKPIRLAALQEAIAQVLGTIRDQDGAQRIEETQPAASLPTKQETVTVQPGLINERKVLAGLGGDRELMAEVLQLFIDDSARLMREMHTAVARKNTEAIRQVAHALKGSIANLPSGTASELAAQIEQWGKSSELARIPPLVERLEPELVLLQQAAEQLLNQLSRSRHQSINSATGVA